LLTHLFKFYSTDTRLSLPSYVLSANMINCLKSRVDQDNIYDYNFRAEVQGSQSKVTVNNCSFNINSNCVFHIVLYAQSTST